MGVKGVICFMALLILMEHQMVYSKPSDPEHIDFYLKAGLVALAQFLAIIDESEDESSKQNVFDDTCDNGVKDINLKFLRSFANIAKFIEIEAAPQKATEDICLNEEQEKSYTFLNKFTIISFISTTLASIDDFPGFIPLGKELLNAYVLNSKSGYVKATSSDIQKLEDSFFKAMVDIYEKCG